jgi:hypothetical protein
METAPSAIDYETRATNLSASAIGVVGLKLLGIHLVARILETLPFLYNAWKDPGLFGGSYPVSSLMLQVGVQLAIALLLLLAARPLARMLFGGLGDGPLEVGPAAWMGIVVAGVGLMFLIFSLDEGIRGIVTIVGRMHENIVQRFPTPIRAVELLELLLPIAKLALGLLLFLRPRWIVGQWMRRAAI